MIMSDGEEEEEKEGSFASTVVMVVSAIGAVILGRFFGFMGVGAAIVGWFVYDYSRKKMGMLMGIIIGLTAGLATYGLAAIGLMLMLN
tara:strand:- start:421 stop:684 length:264 start_codon:yes stop_codon:yes gene_type:complete